MIYQESVSAFQNADTRSYAMAESPPLKEKTVTAFCGRYPTKG